MDTEPYLVDLFPAGTRSVLGRAVAAEIRATMAARQIKIRALATGAGFTSHNYVAIRLRDEKPFTLDDVQMICEFFDEEPDEFIAQAYRKHSERLWTEAEDARSDHLSLNVETEEQVGKDLKKKAGRERQQRSR